MIREIIFEELEKLLPENIYIFSNGATWSLAEYLEDVRILVDESAEEKPAEQEEAPEERPKRRSSKLLKQQILEAWDGGNRTVSQIMNMTGCTYATVKRYIP